MAMAEAAAPTLAVSGLQAWYGKSHILHGVDFEVRPGEVVTLLGRNGAGKTTTLKAIMGIVGKRQRLGRLRRPRDDRPVVRPHRPPRHGDLPRGARDLRQPQRAREPDAAAARRATGGLTLERIFALFPNLAERLASGGGKLSGGEQQMLAIARILRTGARFLMLDEPTEGLAPVIIRQIGHTIAELKREGFTILLVEQNFRFAATVSDRYYVMEHGRIDSASPMPTSTPTTWSSCMCDSASDAAPAGGQGGVRRCSSATPSPPSSSSGNC